MADNSPSSEEVTENPLNGNGNLSAVEEKVESSGDRKLYRKEEFIRTRNQIVDRLGQMKDDLSKVDTEDLGRRAGEWVRKNPVLAVTIAAGAGILIGRGLVSLLTPSAPPPLPVRARRRVRALADNAHDYFDDIGDALSSRAATAGVYLKKKADEAGTELAKKAQEFSRDLADRAADAAESIAESATRARKSAAVSVHDLPDVLKGQAGHGRDVASSLLGTIKAATAALVVKRIGEWMHRA